MKNRMQIYGAILIASLLAAAPAIAAEDTGPDWQYGAGMMGGYGSGYGMGPGMMGGYGRGNASGYGMMGPGMMGQGMMGLGDFSGLNLSSDQKEKITKIRKEMRNAMFVLMGPMMDARDKLQDLYDADKQDAAAIEKQYGVIDDLRRKMVDASIDAHNRINDILTKEQREKFRELRRGRGPMMGGW